MKIWTSEHIFKHPWNTVVQAAWRKYPNPMNPGVTGLDVVEREVDNKGILKSHRLMTTQWGMPAWAVKIVGFEEACYVSEHSEVDPKKQIMTLRSRNLTFASLVTIDEHLVYSPHPTETNSTLLKQESVITVKGVPLGDYMENLIIGNMSKNATKGRQAMDWVCSKIKLEATELCRGLENSIDNVLPHSSKSF